MQFNDNEHLTEAQVAIADDMAECQQLAIDAPLSDDEAYSFSEEFVNLVRGIESPDDEHRAYVALKNRRTIATLLAQRGIPIPASLDIVSE